jgi:peptidyl-prolyl cis-trans isomerase SurA
MEVYDSILNKSDFNKLVQKYSDDLNTKSKDGYIGFVGINQFEKVFEDAIFALSKDGEVSAPIESRIGWHLLKRISKKEELPFPQAKEKIKVLLESDSRYQLAKNKVIDRIKTKNGFMLNSANLETYMKSLPPDFTSFSWEGSPDLPSVELFKLGDKNFNSKDFY